MSVAPQHSLKPRLAAFSTHQRFPLLPCSCFRRRSALLAHRRTHAPIHPLPPSSPSTATPKAEEEREEADETAEGEKENLPSHSNAPPPRVTPSTPKRLHLLPSSKPKSAPPQPRPPAALFSPSSAPASPSSRAPPPPHFFRCLYAARSKKKHKTYEDGLLHFTGRKCALYSEDGKAVVKVLATESTEGWGEESQVVVGNWEMELTTEINEEEFTSGRCFIGLSAPPDPDAPALPSRPPPEPQKPFIPLHSRGASGTQQRPASAGHVRVASSAATIAARLGVDLNDTSLFILNRKDLLALPVKGHKAQEAVVVDKTINRCLRPHQVDGIQFLYDCVVAGRTPKHSGAILADEMGLGQQL